MGIVGDLNKYMQFNAAEGMTVPGSAVGGAVGAGLGAGLGMGMAQQMQPSGPWGASPAAPPPPPPTSRQWHLGEGVATKGPYGESDLQALAQSGALTRGSLVWTAGMEGWKPAAETDLARLFTQVPPPPPGA
jgi:hypothetical protein